VSVLVILSSVVAGLCIAGLRSDQEDRQQAEAQRRADFNAFARREFEKYEPLTPDMERKRRELLSRLESP
jgi:hypothetical protein